jgi:uncharacterized repeat protein (TIGR01451 family)
MNRLLAVFALLTFTGGSFGAEMAFVGTHPTSPLTAFPDIHVLHAHEGRIYMGYGDWNVYPAVVVVSYDPASNAFRLEHSAITDSIGLFRTINGRLYLPSTDPIHFEDFHDYSILENGVWRNFAPSGFFHVFDFATVTGSDLWMLGSKSPNEAPSANGAVLRSLDGGLNWTDVTANSTVGRYYYGFDLNGAFYVYDRVYHGNVATPQTQPYYGFHKPTRIDSAGGTFVAGLAERFPGGDGIYSSTLATFDGSTWRVVRTNVHDWASSGGTAYTLEVTATPPGTQVWKGSSLSVTGAVWEIVPLTIPTNARALEVLGDVLYVGDTAGRLWVGRLDGSTMEQTPATVVNELPDAFGRALAVSGTTLAVGAPDFSGGQPLSGQVTVWQQSDSGWQLQQTIDPPQPSFSGWFGKDVALSGDVMVILETGKDTSGFDRGGDAEVHLYERLSGTWQRSQSFIHGYAHAVALNSNRLAVATSAQLIIYRLTQTNGLRATRETNFSHGVSSGVLYEPTGRVAIDGERIAYGIVGDVSRQGSPGQVNVYEMPTGARRLVATLVQNMPPLPTNLTRLPDAFGFAVALKGNWLAVGAPRDDQAALQAGAVHLYERVMSGSVVSYVRRKTILCPIAQAEAQFGASLAMTDTHLVVGAPGIDLWDRQDGKVFVYERQGTNWVARYELPRPIGAQGLFGRELTATTNLVFAGCRAAAGFTSLEDRVAISPLQPDESTASDVAVTHLVSPSLVTNGSVVTYHITVTNAGPSSATEVRLVIARPQNLEIESIMSSAFACTNTGKDVRCTLASLAAGSSESVVISGRANLEGPCEPMQNNIIAFAREFDSNAANNATTAFVSYELPEIRLTAPTNGTVVPFRAPIEISAESSSPHGIRGVEFLGNGSRIGADVTAPYTFTWTNALPGTNRLTAYATSGCGIVSTSAVVLVIMETNVLPQLTILHPTTGTRFPSGPVNIPIYVSASDADGLTRVDLFWNNSFLRTFFAPPYQHIRTNTTNGTYGLKAIARDTKGGSTTSLVSRIVVGPESDGATNWIAYNDHSPGAATRSTATRWNIQGASPGSGGSLRNISTGATLPTQLSITRSDTSTWSSPGAAPDAGSPAAQIFTGYVDFVTGSAANVPISEPYWVRYSFSGLDPHLRYNFDGTAVRGEATYANRWTLVELAGARSFVASHTAGCLTEGTDTIQSNQVALNTGDNRSGDVVSWQNIQPERDGTFSVLCRQYTGFVPGGSSGGDNGYALTAVRLEEVAVPVDPAPTVLSPVSLTVSPGAVAEFAVTVSHDGPVTYQWLHNGNPISGATTNTLHVGSVSTNHAGSYVAIVYSETGSAASAPAVLTVIQIGIIEQMMERLARLTINGAQGQRYSVEYQNTIDSISSWTPLTNFTFGSSPITLTDNESRNAATRFYRVVPIP